MSIIDKFLEFSDAQALASKSSGAATVSTVQPDMGTGLVDTWGTTDTPELGGMTWNTGVVAALVGAGATVRCDLVTKASASSMSSGATVLATHTFAALAAIGTKKAMQLPVGTTCLRYIATVYTAVGAKLTSATFDSWLGLDNEVRG